MLSAVHNSATKLVSRLMSGRGGKQQRARRVSFGSTTTVFEFERKVFGGGGVPDDDAISLGLGPRLIGSFELPLQEKDAKDEYGCSGCLATEERAELLAQFSSVKAIQREVDSHVAPLVEKTQRERAETAVSAEEQRYMPNTQEEAVRLAMQDAAQARKYLSLGAKAAAALGKPASAIRKKRRRG
jgi:hypothetical protein